MTKKMQASHAQSRQAVFVRCCLYSSFIFAKHSLQYTARPSLGWNGTLASPPQLAHVAMNISLAAFGAPFLALRQPLHLWGSCSKPFSA